MRFYLSDFLRNSVAECYGKKSVLFISLAGNHGSGSDCGCGVREQKIQGG